MSRQSAVRQRKLASRGRHGQESRADSSSSQAGSEQPHRTWKQARRIGWAVGLALMPMIVLAEYVQELIKRVYNTSPFKSYPLDFMANMNPFASSGNYTNRRGIAACKRGWGIGHPIVIIPGFSTTRLEAWETQPCAAKFLGEQLWGSVSMPQALLADSRCWFQHISLHHSTGLDPPGIKLRPSQGKAAMDFLIAGYQVWAPVFEALEDLGYNESTLIAAPYDWRLAIASMEYRDGYFADLKVRIELLHTTHGEKVLIVSHSWGETVGRNFLDWVDCQEAGWTEKHVAVLSNIAGCPLGAPKAFTALLSGEMRDAAELGALPLYFMLSHLPRPVVARVFRSWGSLIGMLPKGGDLVWGNSTWAPDDPAALREAGATNGAFLTKVDVSSSSDSVKNMLKSVAATDHSLNEAMALLMDEALRTSPDLVSQLGMWGASYGLDGDRIGTGYDWQADVRFHDPMVDPMPLAPSMKMVNIYGVGIETERSYVYQHLTNKKEAEATKRGDKLSREVGVPVPWSIETKISDAATSLRAGVRKVDGDGTVPLVSLGWLSYKGWRTPELNPSNFSVITHELQHQALPWYRGIRGGGKSADHVNILGNREMHDKLLALASGHYEEVRENIISNIGEIAEKIPVNTRPASSPPQKQPWALWRSRRTMPYTTP